MKEIREKDYKKPDFLIPNIELYINILSESVVVESKLMIKRNCSNKDRSLVLNGLDLKINYIQIDGKRIEEYEYKNNLLTIINLPDDFTLFTSVTINPFSNKSLEGFYKSGDILCSQNEAEGFRRITFFPDRPDVMTKFIATLEGDKKLYPLLLSNGNLIDKRDLENGRHRCKWEDPFAKPCYLFAIVAGNLELLRDHFVTSSGREITLEIYTDLGMSDRAVHAMESLKKSMIWDEEVFGLEYDLDIYMIVAVDSFNGGAMENKGLNIFNSVYVLAEPQTATDSDFEDIECVIAHEYFHNWTGNRVTCRDWFQLTLKEGLTVFRDQEFSSDMTNRTVKRIEDVSVLRNFQFPEDKGPNSHPIKPGSYIEIDNFYTVTVYEKGAEVIRMIHTLIGKKNFRIGMDLYFERHTGEAVTTNDFVSAMADASGMDFSQFKLWYSQAGTPIIDVTSSYKNGEFTLNISQSLEKTAYNGRTKPMHIPFSIGLYSLDGKDLTPEGANKIILKEARESYTYKTGEIVIPSLLQDFSAPVIVNYSYTIDDLITLFTSDKDNFNRFDAGRRLALIVIDSIIKDIKEDRICRIPEGIVSAYKTLLEGSDLEQRYLATLLYIPEVKNIASTMEEYDYTLANRAKNIYLTLLATELKGELFRVFESNVQENYSFDKKSVAKRSLKNKALAILSYLEDDISEVAYKQFKDADNMTDYMAAYSALQKCNEYRKRANREFIDKWKDNFLVMNKWLTVQASRDGKNVLDDIKALTKHPIFDKTNPNRSRSLYGAFSRKNLAQFHRRDGKGYSFIADVIIDIDGFNSHLSANLAGCFQTYEYLPRNQVALMKKELTRISEKKDISNGLFEIISKTLKTRG